MIMILLFIIFGAIIGLIFGIVSKGEGNVSYTLREIRDAALGAAVPGLIIGGVTGVLLSLFAIFNIGRLSGLLATLVLGILGALGMAIIFAAFAALVKGLSNLIGEKTARILTGLIAGAVIGAILGIFFSPLGLKLMPEYLKFASPLIEGVQKGVKELAKFRYCLYADPKCPFFVSWENPNVQSAKEELYVNVGFSEKEIKDNNLNMLVSLSVKNPEFSELEIKPKCYFKKSKERELKVQNLGAYSSGDEFIFPTSDEEMHTTFRCSGYIPEAIDKNIYNEVVVVELERPVAVKTTWPIWIGSQPRKGIVKSEMKFNAPYIVSLGSRNDLPFNEGREYDFQLTIKRREDDVKLKRIDEILISYPEDILVSCKHFKSLDHELEFRDTSYDNLKNLTQYDKEFDKFIFPCSLYVISAPKEAVMAPIEMDSRYVVYSDYDTRIIKSF